jgi:hypothetical protein
VVRTRLPAAYGDLFTISENPSSKDRKAIEGKFKSTHNVTDRVAQEQARTFFTFLDLADLSAARSGFSAEPEEEPTEVERGPSPVTAPESPAKGLGTIALRYNIQVHLPPTKDIEVYNAIFKSLREHLLVD